MWVIYSLLAAIGFGAITLLLGYLSRANLSPLVVNAWFWLGTAVLYLVSSLALASSQLRIRADLIKWFVLLVIIAFVTNYFSVKALQIGPNTGVVRAVLSLSIVVAAVGGYFLLQQSISAKEGIGMGLVLIGLVLLVWQ